MEANPYEPSRPVPAMPNQQSGMTTAMLFLAIAWLLPICCFAIPWVATTEVVNEAGVLSLLLLAFLLTSLAPLIFPKQGAMLFLAGISGLALELVAYALAVVLLIPALR